MLYGSPEAVVRWLCQVRPQLVVAGASGLPSTLRALRAVSMVASGLV